MPRSIANADPIKNRKADKPPTIEKEWTVLAYLGGENNLFDEMVFAIKAMKSGVTPPPTSPPGEMKFNFNAMVQFAAEEPYRPTSAAKNPIRFRLTPGDFDGFLYKDLEPPRTEPTTFARQPGHPKSYKEELIDFLLWGLQHAQAKHYMVIFSGHGLGIESDFLSKDSTPPQSLTVRDLRDILRDRRVKKLLGHERRIDILGLDSCLMNMVEVGYELRTDVGILIASQGSQANLGWPYKGIFGYLHGASSADPETLATNIVKSFVDYYDDFATVADNSADLSACRLRDNKGDYMQKIKKEIDGLAAALSKQIRIIKDNNGDPVAETGPESEFAKALIFAHWYAQTYHFDQYVDIQDFCDILVRNLPRRGDYDAIRNKCRSLTAAVRKCVIGIDKRNYAGPLYQYSHGLSIYLPWSDVYALYNSEQLAFLEGGEWQKFVDNYIACTRRKPREELVDEKLVFIQTKDSPPHSKGDDDPRLRAKNPPSVWGVPHYFIEFARR